MRAEPDGSAGSSAEPPDTDRSAAAHRLADAAHRKHEQTMAAATAALRRLEASGEPVTYAGVAAAAGVSRAWLYTQPDIRAAVDRLRVANRAGRTPVPTRQRASETSLQRRLEAALMKNRQLAQQVTDLKAQLAAAHGALRDARAGRAHHDRDVVHLPTGRAGRQA